MRKIKFKVWEQQTNTMWKEPVTIQDICNFGIEAARDEWHAGNYEGECENPIEGAVFLQFTGLLDKNGKEIYEGDIIRYPDFSNGAHFSLAGKKDVQPKRIAAVIVSDLLLGFRPYGSSTFDGEKVEIIGNIYENPELLNPQP